jgi:hypothetical protein
MFEDPRHLQLRHPRLPRAEQLSFSSMPQIHERELEAVGRADDGR